MPLAVVLGYCKRFVEVISCLKSDYVYVYREITPFGPPVFEWILAKVFKAKLIFDFDDAIWISDEKNPLKLWLRNASKTNRILSLSYKVTVGNQYLANYARKFNSNVIVIPTTIDTEGLHNSIKEQHTSKLVIGWTGSHSTLKYLNEFAEVVAILEKKYEFDFVVICNENPNYSLKSFRFIPWRKESEIQDLLSINIGVMPLSNDEWTKGKCGFKALQYMSLGIPTVVSPVGANNDIVQEGENGFFASSTEEWIDKISQLMDSENLRKSIGRSGIETVEQAYSVSANKKKYLNLFS